MRCDLDGAGNASVTQCVHLIVARVHGASLGQLGSSHCTWDVVVGEDVLGTVCVGLLGGVVWTAWWGHGRPNGL